MALKFMLLTAFAAASIVVLAIARPLSAATATYTLVNTIGSAGSGNGQFNSLRRVAVNSAGDVWVADQGNNRLEEFDSNGSFLQSIGSNGSGNGQFSGPQGVTVDANNNVWVADSGNNRIEELSPTGAFIQAFGSYGSGAGQISDAQAIAIGPSGNVWINDWWNNRIDEFTSNGTFVRMFGSNGSGPGQFAWLGGLTTDAFGNVYVADAQNNRVQEFTSSGVYTQSFGTAQLSFPNDVARDPSGNIWVASTWGEALDEYSSGGTYLGQISLSFDPISLAFGPSGTLWVADQGDNHLLEYKQSSQPSSQPSTWNVDASGKWSAAGNWANGVPNSANSSVLFGPVITSARTVSTDVAVTAGTLTFNSTVAYAIAGSQTITLQATSADAAIVVTSGSHTISANVALASNTDVTMTNPGNQLTLSGTISGVGMALNEHGAGLLVLAGSNTFSGATNIDGGTLTLANSLAVHNSTVNIAGGGLTFSAGNTRPVIGGLAGNGNLALTTTAAEPVTLNVGGNGLNNTYSGVLGGPGGFVKQGAGTLVLVASNTYAGATAIAGGMLKLQPLGAGSIGIHFIGTSSNGPFNGTGGVVPMSNWNSESNYTFNGVTLANNSGGNSGATFSINGATSIWATGSANELLNGYIASNGFNPMTLTVSGIPYSRYSMYVYVGDSSVGYQEEATINGSTYYYATLGGGPIAYSAITNTSSASYQSGNYIEVDGLHGGTQSVTMEGTTQQYSGLCDVEIVNTAPAGGTNILPATTALSIAGGGTLDVAGNSQQVASLSDGTSGGGGRVISSSSTPSVLTVSPSAGSTTFSGTIQGGGTLGAISLVVNGSGTQTLSGSNTYTGSTTIDGVELVVNGSLASPVTVNGGGILGGTGSLTSAIVSSGGTLAPGDAPGALNISGSLTLVYGSVMDYELGTEANSDEILMPNGLLTLNGQQFGDFGFSPLAGFGPGKYTLIDAGSFSGSLGSGTSGAIGGLPASIAMQGDNLVLTVVPEPGTLALLGASAVGLVIIGLRCRHARVSIALFAVLSFASAIAQAQNIYVANGGNGTIGKYTTSGGTVNASLVSGLSDPAFLALSGSNLFVSNQNNGAVGEYTTSGGTVNASLLSGLNNPVGLAVSGSNVFVATFYGDSIGEFTTSGATVNASLVSGVNSPTGLAVSGTNMFVANWIGGTVGEYTTSGATVNTALISGLSAPNGIAVSGSNVFIVNQSSGKVGEYTTSGAVVNTALISGLSTPIGIAVSGSNLFVVNQGSGTVGEYTLSGSVVNTALISGLSAPNGIVIAPAGPINGAWTNGSGGNWSVSGNWSGGNVPGVSGNPTDTATFGVGAATGSAVTVALDTSAQLSAMLFSSTSGYLIKSSSASVLTLSATNGLALVTVNSGAQTIATPLTLATSAAIAPASGALLTISGAISGAGGLSLTGPGTLILSGSNSYTGGTTVSAGALQGSTASLQGTITDNATLVFNQATDGTYAGSITGNGGLTVTGTREQTLAGADTLSSSGAVVINQGTLAAPYGISHGGAAVTVAAGATFQAGGQVKRAVTGAGTVTATSDLIIGVSTQSGQFDQGGVPGVGGTLNVGGNAVAIFSADTAILGSQTNIGAGGSLFVNSAQLGNPASVDATKVLTATGNATINANFVNNGVVNGPTGSGQELTFKQFVKGAGSTTGNVEYQASYQPSNSPNAVSVQNLLLDSTSTLIMELAGTSPGSGYDQLEISGLAMLNGTLDLELIDNFTPSQGKSFDILNGSTTGAFTQMDLPTLPNGMTWNTAELYSTGVITVVPEPGTLALLAVSTLWVVGTVIKGRFATNGGRGRWAPGSAS